MEIFLWMVVMNLVSCENLRGKKGKRQPLNQGKKGQSEQPPDINMVDIMVNEVRSDSD